MPHRNKATGCALLSGYRTTHCAPVFDCVLHENKSAAAYRSGSKARMMMHDAVYGYALWGLIEISLLGRGLAILVW